MAGLVSAEATSPRLCGRSPSLVPKNVVQFCVQFVPNLSVPGAVKVLVEVPGTTRMNWYGLGADIF